MPTRRPRSGIRILGVDDGPVPPARGARVFVAAPVVRLDGQMDGLLTTQVRRDGWNATERLLACISGSRFLPQLHMVMLDGIALGGLNVVDIQRLARELERPVVVVIRRRPDPVRFSAAVARLPHPERRMARVARAGSVTSAGPIYCQCAGMDIEEARTLVRLSTHRGNIPEPVRLAHMIAGGVVTGESQGRA